MFCYQCEQTAGGTGCTRVGVCGKSPEVAALQDLLVYALKGLSAVAVEARKTGVSDADANRFTCEAAFSTLTNVNFDPERFLPLINRAVEHRERLKKRLGKATKTGLPEAARFKPDKTLEAMIRQGAMHGVLSNPDIDPDVNGLQWLLIFGIKGVAAYADHAAILGKEDEKVYEFIHRALASTLDHGKTVPEMYNLVMECGAVNLLAMELLDAGNTERFGHPVPTEVPLGHRKGKVILVSGHDLQDLKTLLEQTEGKGITVYTHGEMLPTHGYPELKKHSHFYGHYGTAWQNQQREFREFPGAILMTTNCIQKPVESYRDNIFTTGLVGWPGVTHVGDKDFTPVIMKALEMPGFKEDDPGDSVTVGFARNAVMSVAGTVIDAVKAGKIRHFFLVGGCDGAKPGRSYYTEFVEKTPKDTVVLTLACGKFRFFDMKLGDIGGIPRLLDVGQCNDAYSAV
ncbi:hydroxylamine reductase, partial [Candidatus Bathyarchaeota archaeon]|nr:hydroxylamine reductase [Candidatus Bathyarchaeota archaeon]